MTEVPHDQKAGDADNLPEPPFEELYSLFCDALAYDRKRWMARAGDPNLEEEIAITFQPNSREHFLEFLEQCAARGCRARVVNCLVLGPAYCDAHPDDPRIKPSPEETASQTKRLQDKFKDAWARRVVEGESFGLPGDGLPRC